MGSPTRAHPITYGAGVAGTRYWDYYKSSFLATPGTNQVTVTINPEHSLPETNYADNSQSFSFTTNPNPRYTVSQIRDAYGINSLPNFGSTPANGSGQTIAVIDAGNDPPLLSDVDGFDQAMNVSTNSSPTLYQEYGASSSFLTVYNQSGANITALLGDTGTDGVPSLDSEGYGEETLDVEWAHAIAPGAKIDVVEVNPGTSSNPDGATNLLVGDQLAAGLPGVSVVSNSYISPDISDDPILDSTYLNTPLGHEGVTFLASTGDSGNPGGYPASSPNVVAVGASQLSLNGDAYVGETGWSYPTPTIINNDARALNPSSAWTPTTNNTAETAAAGSQATATWTAPVGPEKGWNDRTEVSVTWTANPANATNATYDIYNGTPVPGNFLGSNTVNQREAPVGTPEGNVQFQSLGTYNITNGTLTVVLSSNSANGNVVADTIGIAEAWASGGGENTYEAEPSYQRSVQNTGFRTIPDVSFDGSDTSGVLVYRDAPGGRRRNQSRLSLLGGTHRDRQPGARRRRRLDAKQSERSDADVAGPLQSSGQRIS